MAAQKRDVYKAADVCQVAQVQPYVLRSWEAEFPKLGTPGPGGLKIYGQADLDLVLQIKALVYGEGLTLAGARRRLEEEGDSGTAASDPPLVLFDDAARERLRQVRQGLTDILDLRGDGAPQLRLVPTPAPAGEASAAARPVARKRRTPA
jgi:DNA-binding transcriptional MerR regulator